MKSYLTMTLSLALTLALFAVTTQGYCDFKSRTLQTEISKALLQANRFVIEAQEDDGKWINEHTTGHALFVLKLLGYNNNEGATCAKTFKKAAKYFNASEGNAHGAELALFILGLNALCEDPSAYHGWNLTKLLLADVMNFPKGKFNHYFQYSLALLTLGINDVNVPFYIVDRILNKVAWILRTKARHTKEDCAMFVMGLQSVAKQFKHKKLQLMKINRVIKKLSTTLEMKTEPHADDLQTVSLVMQAHSSLGKELDWKEDKCEKAYKFLLSKKGKDGSFGSLGSALTVLPALAGTSFVDFKKCHIAEPEMKKKGEINVHVNIEFEAINKENPEEQTVQVPHGSTAIDALRAAAAKHDCFVFETVKTSWGPHLTTLCRNRMSHEKKVYWMYLVNQKMAKVGIGKYVVQDGDSITFRYQKMKF